MKDTPAENMYADVILDYYRNPRNYGSIKNADARASDVNPLCGDEIEISLKIEKNKIADIKFSGHGCAISQASASMLTEVIKGKTLDEIKALGKDDVLGLLGIEISHVRIKCALLGLKVLKLVVYSYLGQKMDEEEAEKF
jgi:nitrogen fixation NifU-like protein